MNNPLTKICKNCGQQKPLSAFLQLSDSKGTTYGNICAHCRKTYAEKSATPDVDEKTTSTTGKMIDSKAKVQSEIDKRKLRQQIQEDYREEREKQGKKQIAQIQKVINTAQQERKHRTSFLDKSQTTTPKVTPADKSMIIGGVTRSAEEGQFHLNQGPIEDTRITGKIKHTQNEIFRAFINWAGKTPIGDAMKNQAAVAKEKNLKNKEIKVEEKSEADPLNNYLNKKKF